MIVEEWMRNGEKLGSQKKNWKRGGVGVVGVAWHGIIIEDSALPGHHSIPRKKVLQRRQPHTHAPKQNK